MEGMQNFERPVSIVSEWDQRFMDLCDIRLRDKHGYMKKMTVTAHGDLKVIKVTFLIDYSSECSSNWCGMVNYLKRDMAYIGNSSGDPIRWKYRSIVNAPEWTIEFPIGSIPTLDKVYLLSEPYTTRSHAGSQGSGCDPPVDSGNTVFNSNANNTNKKVFLTGCGSEGDDNDDEDDEAKWKGVKLRVPNDPEPDVAAGKKEAGAGASSAFELKELKSLIFNDYSLDIPALGAISSPFLWEDEADDKTGALHLQRSSAVDLQQTIREGSFRSVLNNPQLQSNLEQQIAQELNPTFQSEGPVAYGYNNDIITFADQLANGKVLLEERKKGGAGFEGVIQHSMEEKLVIKNGRYEFSSDKQWKVMEQQRPKNDTTGYYGTCHVVVDNTSNFCFVVKEIDIADFNPMEVQVLSILDHPNIVQLYGVLRRQDCVLILLEYVDGGTLTEAKDRGLYWKEPVFFYLELLHCLDYMSEKHVCHNDIGENNLMLRQNGSLVLIDFGLAEKCPDQFLEEYNTDMKRSGEIFRGCLDLKALPDIKLTAEWGEDSCKNVLYDLYKQSRQKSCPKAMLRHPAFKMLAE